MEYYESTAERTMLDLCEQVDYWKLRALQAEQKASDIHTEYMESTSQSLNNSMNTIGTLFKVMLNSEQTENGILIKQSHDKKH